ncbi:DUF3995 domain-containing protein [Rhodococcoides yunnanense]|uniref:DUF3995 domain-containing protein n=1 Tax=Rhodococcoides yunnanense TaxID=278209 RepID=UPI0009331AB6|nr:DUF3995 domain-containing protein [Rhodococcus yunnanensis]
MGARNWFVVGAVGWCCAFAALHVFWALGGSTGLASSAGTELAASRPTSFVVFGLWGVAAALIVAAVLVRAASNPSYSQRLRRILGWLLGAAGLAMLVRGVLIQIVLLTDAGDVRSAVGPEQTRMSLILWNPWFIVGGVLFLSVSYQVVRKQRSSIASPAAHPPGL